jgi:holo-[acyl-carrier protein] synthase
MIVGIGTDMVDARRLDAVLTRHGRRALNRIFTEAEQNYAESAKDSERRLMRYANRFAAKEAGYKALACHGMGVQWRDVEVTRDTASGKPCLYFHGAALRAGQEMTPPKHHLHTHLSLSDEYPYCTAFVVLSLERLDC